MTIRSLLLSSTFVMLAGSVAHAADERASAIAVTSAPAAARYKTNLPPSADLDYAVTAKQSGFSLDGKAHVTWQASSGKFLLDTEMRATLLGRILDARTEGGIDDFGLAPLTFTEKRFRKDPASASFNRDTRTITLSQSDTRYPIKGGEQDRNSAVWQLVAVARAAPGKFKAGSEWSMFVVGSRDAEPWVFKVLKHEKIRTPLGDLDTMHVLKTTPESTDNRQKVDIWLAPSVEWYPARIRYTEPDGDFIEQVLSAVAKKSPN